MGGVRKKNLRDKKEKGSRKKKKSCHPLCRQQTERKGLSMTVEGEPSFR